MSKKLTSLFLITASIALQNAPARGEDHKLDLPQAWTYCAGLIYLQCVGDYCRNMYLSTQKKDFKDCAMRCYDWVFEYPRFPITPMSEPLNNCIQKLSGKGSDWYQYLPKYSRNYPYSKWPSKGWQTSSLFAAINDIGKVVAKAVRDKYGSITPTCGRVRDIELFCIPKGHSGKG